MKIVVLNYVWCEVEVATLSEEQASKYADNAEEFITEVMGYDLNDIHYMVADDDMEIEFKNY